MRPGVTAVSVLGGIAAAAAAAAGIGRIYWNRGSARAAERLTRLSSAAAERFEPGLLEGLPEPVVRYFAFALTPGQHVVKRSRLEQEGVFRTGGLDAPWHPFTATELFTADPPGFVWDAAIRMAPLISVYVRDGYIGGQGQMQAKLAAVVPVVDEAGSPELNAGALHRYLAEMVWLPTALLRGEGVAWDAIDENSARATLTDAGLSVSLEFHFAESGEIARAYTHARMRNVAGEWVPTPWECHYRRYERVQGMMIPIESEVEWVLPEGRLSYWQGRIVRAEYHLGRP